jgi:hypothetical protein
MPPVNSEQGWSDWLFHCSPRGRAA